MFFDRVAENINAPKITTNDYESGFKATEHLIKNGCKKIAFLSISTKLSIANYRMNGYLDAAKKHGVTIDNKHIVTCDADKEENRNTIRKLLKQTNRPDAIFACVEELAVSSYVICQELQLAIPNDIKIMSFSNLQTAAILNPSLTTITQPAYDIGREAASVLFQLMENKGPLQHNGDVILNSELIVRNSTKMI